MLFPFDNQESASAAQSYSWFFAAVQHNLAGVINFNPEINESRLAMAKNQRRR
jgi:hypothetical protein